MGIILDKLRELYRRRGELGRQAAWLAAKARPCAGRLGLLFVLQTLASVIAVVLTLLNKRLIDQAIRTAGCFDAAAFTLIAVLTLVNMAMGFGTYLISSRISVRYSLQMRSELLEHLLHSEWMRLKAYHSADIQTRAVGELQTISDGILELVPEVLGLIVRFALAFVVLFRYDRMLALAALLLGPLGLLCSLVFAGKMKEFHVRWHENDAQLRAFMQESTEHVIVMKAFGMEPELMRRYDGLRAERQALVWKRDLYSSLSRMSMNLVFTLGHLLALGWGILRVAKAEITYGTLSIFLSLIGQVQAPIMSMGNVVSQFIGVLAAAGRMMELEALPLEETAEPCPLQGRVGVDLRDVCFNYHPENPEKLPVLQTVNLHVAPGETVALVGATGSGKTTIARLLLRLIVPDEGAVVFCDASGREAPASAGTRALLAYVPQGNTLSSGTIRENLLAGQTADEDRIRTALHIAEADFALDLGLDARIGERGVGLSEGQAQRLAIARALLRDAPFLILDEASASLDMETEQKIMENLRRAKTGKTCLVITHRPSLLSLCDRCYAVHAGQVAEQPLPPLQTAPQAAP